MADLVADAATVRVVVRGMEVLVERRDGATHLVPHDAALAVGEVDVVDVGEDEQGRRWYASHARNDIALPAGLSFSPVRPLFAEWPEATLHMLGRALACVEFEDTHRFCGRCGTGTTTPAAPAPASPSAPASSSAPASPSPSPSPSPSGSNPLPGPVTSPAAERTRSCPRCGLTFHPRIPPAIIVLVERGDELLLARGAQFPPGRFSAVAGFVEIGESLEQAARREVKEEVGVDIGELRYFSSQPWPFGHSLMIGFHARYLGGEVRPDGVEIVEASWFPRGALPLLPPPISIARKMIDNFLAHPRARP
jgi:NAD+ diphosphatase